MTATAAPRRRPWPTSRPVEIENVSVRFGAIKALSDVSFTVEPGTIHAVIGPERRRQVDDVQRAVRRLQGRPRGRFASASTASTGCGRTRSPARRRPRLPEHRAVGRPDGRREPHARPPPPDQGRLHRRRPAAAAGDPRGEAARGARRRDRRVPRARRQAAHARGRPVLRRPEAGRGRSGAVHRAAAAAARRAGRRHERRGDPPHGARRSARSATALGHLRRPRRARHGHGHVASPTGSRCSTSDAGSPTAPRPRCRPHPEVIRAYLGSGDEINPADAAAHHPSATPGTHS